MTPQANPVTTPLSDRPLTAEDVALLREGDLLRVNRLCEDGPAPGSTVLVCRTEGPLIWIEGDDDSWWFDRFTFVSRPTANVEAGASEGGPFVPIIGQSFSSEQDWINRASRALTRHPEYNNTEHGEATGWRGPHFTALCFDQAGNRMRQGSDFKRATSDGTYPAWWVWPDQIAAALTPSPPVQLSEREREAVVHLDRLLTNAPWLAGDDPVAGIGLVTWNDLRTILAALTRTTGEG